jgi:hypothetical protein
MNDFLDDFEAAAEDYNNMGPLWAEMVFPDDFEALQAICGGREAIKSKETTRVQEIHAVTKSCAKEKGRGELKR